MDSRNSTFLAQFVGFVSMWLSFCYGAISCAADQPQITPDIAHGGFISAIDISPKGDWFVTGSEDRTLKLWKLPSGRLLRTLIGHSGTVSAVAISSDGKLIASGSEDRTIAIWDSSSGMHKVRLKAKARVLSLAMSNTSTILVSASPGVLQVWNLATGAPLSSIDYNSFWRATSLSLSSDGNTLVAVFGASFGQGIEKILPKKHKLLVINIGAPTPTLVQERDLPDAYTAVLSGDGKRVSYSNEEGVSVINVVGGETVLARTRTRNGSLAFSKNGTLLIAAIADGTQSLLNIEQVSIETTLADSPKYLRDLWVVGPPLVASSEIGGYTIASIGRGVIVWDNTKGRLLGEIAKHETMIRAVAPVKSSNILATVDQNEINIWDLDVPRISQTAKIKDAGAHSISFLRDGLVVPGVADPAFKVLSFDMKKNRIVAIKDKTKSPEFHWPIDRLDISRDGSLLALAYGSEIQVWNLSTRSFVGRFKESDIVADMQISRDMRWLLSFSTAGTDDDTMKIEIWDILRRRLKSSITVGTINSFSISQSSKWFASGGMDGRVKMWSLPAGRLIKSTEIADLITNVVVSDDDRVVAAGTGSGNIRIIEARTGRILGTLAAHSDGINGLSLLSGGRLVSTSKDGTIRVWNLAKGELLVTLYGRGGEWIAITPAGFFSASSPNAGVLLTLARGLEWYGFDQMWQSLFNPDLVREVLAGDPSREAKTAGQLVNLVKVIDSGPAPTVAIASPVDASESPTELVAVVAHVTDSGKGIGRIEWRVNGVTAAVAMEPPRSGPTYTVIKQLALDPGDNVIEVVAYNAGNLLASLPARITVKFIGTADKTKPKLHILAIGINDYVHFPRHYKLTAAVNDATAFAAAMQKAGAGLYDDVRVTLALDGDATRDGLNARIDEIAANIHPRDTFILFAAAHGKSKNGRYHLIAHDYDPDIGDFTKGTISQDHLQDWLANRIKARKALILLDTCESGAVVAGHAKSRTDVPISEAGVGRLHEATGRPVLAAAAATQSAFEPEIPGTSGQHGYFTYALLHALSHADTNGNGLIELSELVAHVQHAVPKIVAGKGLLPRSLTTLATTAKQSPRFGSRGEDFAVAKRLR